MPRPELFFTALDSIVQPIRSRDWVFSLEPMRDLLAALDDPQQSLRAIVVAGSSGKGSTCAAIAHCLRAQGLNVGLYTSPHLHSFRERIVYNDQPISMDAFVEQAQIIRAVADSLSHHFSTFELASALALHWFAAQHPDFVVLEVGLGGRYDAVNAVDNILAVLTHIEDEHAAMLGGSLKTVAEHKAGIIQPGGYALTVAQSPEVMAILNAEAQDKQAALQVVAAESRSEATASLMSAVCAQLYQRGLLPEAPQNLTVPRLPGRLELVQVKGRNVLIDGGHTPEAAHYLYDAISRLAAGQPVLLVVGMLADKKARDYLAVFDRPKFQIVLTAAPGHRGLDPAALAAQTHFHHATLTVEPDLTAALRRVGQSETGLDVVAGSLRMAAAAREAFGLLDSDALVEAQATRAIFDGGDYLRKLLP